MRGRHHFVRGARTSTANNSPAYGYSLVAAGSFAALEKEHGAPSWADLFLFGAGACVAFAGVNAVSTRLFCIVCVGVEVGPAAHKHPEGGRED
jgi:hypothetical protein